MGGLRVFTRAAALVKIAILARILTPYDFGLFGIAALALSFFETLTETGVNQAVIHSDRKTEELVDSAWVVAIVRGFLISILILTAARPISNFFRDSGVLPLVWLAAAVPLVKGFINPMVVKFLKELEFGNELKFRSALVLVDAAAAVTAAFVFKSAAALVLALLVTGLVEVLMSFYWFKIWPRLRLQRRYLREILGYGKWMTLSGVLSWAAGEIDDLVAGRWFGTGTLGIYQQAYKISTLPVTEISGTVNQVAFPVLAKVRADKNRFWRIFKASVGGIGVIGVIGGAILWFFPESVVMLLLGKQWLGSAPLIRYLAVFGVIRNLESGLQPTFLALGRPQTAAWGNAIKVLALAAGLMIWGRSGISGVALAAVVSGAAAVPYYLINLARLGKLGKFGKLG
jgi:O-antigen/teichoic acid export membrane protein